MGCGKTFHTLGLTMCISVYCGLLLANPILDVKPNCPAFCVCRTNLTVVTCSNLRSLEYIDLPTAVSKLDLKGSFLGSNFTLSSRNIPDLTFLDISNNRIAVLQGSAFINLRKLTHMILHHNQLQKLEDTTFKETIKLEVLDLSFNNLRTIPDKPFRHLVNLKSLNISYNMIQSLVIGLRFQVLTQLQIFDLSGNRFEIVPSEAFQMANAWDDRILRHVNISFCHINTIESKAFEIPGLTSLNLAGNPNIVNANFSEVLHELQISDIRHFDLSRMNISRIDEIFEGTEQFPFHEISFAHNELSELTSNLSFYLPQVKKLNLEYNKITLLGKTISKLTNLKYLDLSHNLVNDVNISRELRYLEVLILSDNQISEIEVNFSEFFNLRYLDLSLNNLSYFVVPSNLGKLEYLDLARNRILSLNTFAELTALEYFDVSSNLLTSLNSFLFVGAPKIRIANFSRNSISALSHQAFHPHTPHSIDLSFNRLVRIMNCAWQQTAILMLQNNMISNLDRHTFQDMIRLNHLDLSANNIVELWPDMFMFLTNLTDLSLQDNILDTSPKTLANLLSPLKQLQKLNLSSNNITSLDETVFEGLKNLISVSVAKNRISHMISDVFKKLENLKFLDISDNPFKCDCELLDLQSWIQTTSVRLTHSYMTSYRCHIPAQHSENTIVDFQVDLFECQPLLLYITVIGSLGGFVMILAAIAAISCHYYHKCRQSKIEKTKAKVLKYLGMNGHFLNMEGTTNRKNSRMMNGVVNSMTSISPRESLQFEELNQKKSRKPKNDRHRKRSYSLETDFSNLASNSRRISSIFPLKSNLKNKQNRRYSELVAFGKGVRFRHRPYSRSHQPSLDLSNNSEEGIRSSRKLSADRRSISHEHRNSKSSSVSSTIGRHGHAVNSDIIRFPSSTRMGNSMPNMIGYVNSISSKRRSRAPVIYVDPMRSKNRSQSWIGNGYNTLPLFPQLNRKFSSLDRARGSSLEMNGIRCVGRRKSSLGSRSVWI